MLYRIITEDDSFIVSLVKRYFDSFTSYPAKGVYTNDAGITLLESALIVEIDDLNCSPYLMAENNAKVFALIKDIKKSNNQECVLLQRIPTNSQLV